MLDITIKGLRLRIWKVVMRAWMLQTRGQSGRWVGARARGSGKALASGDEISCGELGAERERSGAGAECILCTTYYHCCRKS